MESAQERAMGRVPRLRPDQVRGHSKTQGADPKDLARGLSGGYARCREDPESDADEDTPFHQLIA
jgi:hypothetical protein